MTSNPWCSRPAALGAVIGLLADAAKGSRADAKPVRLILGYVFGVTYQWIVGSTQRALAQPSLNSTTLQTHDGSIDITRERLLAAALESPKLVGVHDKEGWLALFAPDATIEDPVGSPPSGPDPLERSLFYDTFIASNQVSLSSVDADRLGWVATERRAVLRALRIDCRLPNGAVMRVPVHAVYRFDEHLRVKSLRAHWEVAQNMPVLKLWSDIFRTLIGSTQAFIQIFRVRGISYTCRYILRTMLLGAGAAEKRQVFDFARAVTKSDYQSLMALFANDAVVSFQVQNQDFKPSDLGCSGLKSIEVAGLRGAGTCVSFDFKAQVGQLGTHVGVGIFHFTSDRKIQIAELYFAD